MKFEIIVIILAAIIGFLDAANILCAYLIPSFSHHQVFKVLTLDLLARGHHLTVITSIPNQIDNQNLTQIGIKYLFQESSYNFSDVKNKDMFSVILDVLPEMYRIQSESEDVRKLIENKDNRTFDLVIVENLFSVPWFALAKVYNAPLVTIKSSDALPDAHADMGNVINPVIHPEVSLKLTPPLNFLQRWRSLKFHLWSDLYYHPKMNEISNNVLKKYFPGIETTAEDLRKSVQLLLINAHPVMGNVRPIVPTTIQLGFMHIEEPKPLPDDLKSFMDKSENGVIYMSLGTNMKSSHLGWSYLQLFSETFKLLKYDVLWKFETSNTPSLSDNVKISKWFPQADLLAHPKLKLFITQGGQQSMEEAIDRTVPMIAIPFISDQYSNAEKISKWKIGVHLDISDLTVDNFKESIVEVLKPEYKKNIQHIRDLVYDQPMTSREKAVWWVEYVLRHNGTQHLDYIGRHIPFYQKYFLDFISLFLLGITIVTLTLGVLVKIVIKAKKGKSKNE